MRKTKDIKTEISTLAPTLIFYTISTVAIVCLHINYGLPNNAHSPGLHQVALVGLLFTSVFLGFKNAMSTKKSSHLIVLIHTIALLTILSILSL